MTTVEQDFVRVLFPGPLSNAEYFALPETTLPMELFEGKVLMSPSPTAWHQDVVAQLFEALRRLARRERGRAFAAPLDVELREKLVFQPDIVYLAPGSTAEVRDHIHGAPDIVVEVLSPGTRRYDLEDKRPKYAEAGVREFWAVDPAARTVTVEENGGGIFSGGRTVPFGEAIPSAIVDIGDGGLGALRQ